MQYYIPLLSIGMSSGMSFLLLQMQMPSGVFFLINKKLLEIFKKVYIPCCERAVFFRILILSHDIPLIIFYFFAPHGSSNDDEINNN